MIKIFLIAAIVTLNIFADILSIHKKIVPITILQSNKIVTKENKIIKLAIIVNKTEELKAIKFMNLLPNDVKSYKLDTTIIFEKDLQNRSQLQDFDALYCFNLNSNSYKFISNFAIDNKKLTFSYTKKGLDNGLLFYIDFTNKIKIYINRSILIKSKILFNSRFLGIVYAYSK